MNANVGCGKLGEVPTNTVRDKYLNKDKAVTIYTTTKNNNANPNTCYRNA